MRRKIIDPNLPGLSVGKQCAQTSVFLGLLDPFAQGLGNTADFWCNGRNHARLPLKGDLMLEYHPDRTRADLIRVTNFP